MIIIVDTSVLVAALLRPKGFVLPLLFKAVQGDYLLCVSQSILTELRATARNRGVSAAQVAEFIEKIDQITTVVDAAAYSPTAVAADDHVLACYLKCNANLILTSDKAFIRRLTKLGIAAVPPSQFQAYFPKES